MTPPPQTVAAESRPTRHRRLRSTPDHTAIPPTDGELLGLFLLEAKNGDTADHAAFRQLVDRHGPMVWRICRQVLSRHEEAEDAFQATFLILARRAGSIRANDSAAGWLYRVAHRTALAARRRAHKRKETRMENEPLAPPEAAFPDLAGRETAAVMMEELATMPAKYRTPLVLRYLEGRSRREIAEQSDTTVATVQGQLARGKALLRSRLLRRGVSLSLAMTVVAGGSAKATESAPAHVITQTTSNATAVAAGGSLAASTAVVLLYREGVRAMFVSEAMKPLALAAIVLMLATGAAIGSSTNEAPASSPAEITLNAIPPAEEQAAPPAAAAETITFAALHDESVDDTDSNLEITVAFPVDGAQDPDSDADVLDQDTLSIIPKTWEITPGGVVIDPETKKPLLDEEAKRRMRNYYASAPSVGLQRQPWLEAVLRHDHLSQRYSMLVYEVEALEQQLHDSQQATVEQTDQLAELKAEANLTHADLLAAGRELQAALSEAPATGKSAVTPKKPRNTLAPGDSVVVHHTSPSGAHTQYLLKVNDKGQLDLSESSWNEYGAVDVAGLTPKEAVRAVANRFREVDNAPETAVLLEAKIDKLTTTAVDDGQRKKTRAEPTKTKSPEAALTSINDYQLQVGQRVNIAVVGGPPNDPIGGEYVIERFGTIALRPTYGRVKIAGLSVLEAEKAIKEHLLDMFSHVEVQLSEAPAPAAPAPHDAALQLTPQQPRRPQDDTARLAPFDYVDASIWGASGSSEAYSGGFTIDADGSVFVNDSYGSVTSAPGMTLAELQQAMLQQARRTTGDQTLQVRLMHDRFGVVGGADEPGAEESGATLAIATPVDEECIQPTPETVDKLLAEINALIDEAEKEAAKAKQLATQTAHARAVTRSSAPPRAPDDAITQSLRGLTVSSIKQANDLKQQINTRVSNWIVNTVEQGAEAEDIVLAQQRLTEASQRLMRIDTILKTAQMRSQSGMLRRFVPKPGLDGPRNVKDWLNRAGVVRGVTAELPLGGTLTHKVFDGVEFELVTADNQSLTLRPTRGSVTDGLSGLQEVMVVRAERDEPICATIDGKPFFIHYKLLSANTGFRGGGLGRGLATQAQPDAITHYAKVAIYLAEENSEE